MTPPKLGKALLHHASASRDVLYVSRSLAKPLKTNRWQRSVVHCVHNLYNSAPRSNIARSNVETIFHLHQTPHRDC